MKNTKLPLKEVSIRELFAGSEKLVFEIPIYQRNYAWEEDEISALIQDVYDSFKKGDNVDNKIKDEKNVYYIGTLVTFHKGDNVFEIIDGQQRLTTIRLILDVLEVQCSNRLTYRARKKADDTLKALRNLKDLEEKDRGIENGLKYARIEIDRIVDDGKRTDFKNYFLDQVHLIHYYVPKDIDLNHYFEIMNSRGEQLEKHEIIKAKLMKELKNSEERESVNLIWECCSKMGMYVQHTFDDSACGEIFGKSIPEFLQKGPKDFTELHILLKNNEKVNDDKGNGEKGNDEKKQFLTINEILNNSNKYEKTGLPDDKKQNSFQPIIDFPNFLLIVLKILRMSEEDFKPTDFILDDKELLNEFADAKIDEEKARKFVYILLKAKYFLDNCIVHHSNEEDTLESNPWELQVWHKEEGSGVLSNLSEGSTKEAKSLQNKLVNLLSMFEVSFTARQRKNYLFYCLFYLMKYNWDLNQYAGFLELLADNYFAKIYMDGDKLNEINTPKPGSFDETILKDNELNINGEININVSEFDNIYGNGTTVSKGVPLFVFNYLDYKIWNLYDKEVRGEKLKESSTERKDFFDKLGCNDFGLDIFDQFYFSRTRRSLEHFYPQANVTGEDGLPTKEQINCFGNYAMIGSEANSSGSNWDPKTKVIHYKDKKIKQISVASLKFFIMMQICSDKDKWGFNEIQAHQKKMVALLLGQRE